jgi:hypothetical protein
MDFAQSVGNGARLPTQLEAVFAFTTSRAAFEQDDWYWTSTQTSSFTAFVQGFEYGTSRWGSKVNDYRVRPFRGLDLQTFAPLIDVAVSDIAEKNTTAEQV